MLLIYERFTTDSTCRCPHDSSCSSDPLFSSVSQRRMIFSTQNHALSPASINQAKQAPSFELERPSSSSCFFTYRLFRSLSRRIPVDRTQIDFSKARDCSPNKVTRTKRTKPSTQRRTPTSFPSTRRSRIPPFLLSQTNERTPQPKTKDSSFYRSMFRRGERGSLRVRRSEREDGREGRERGWAWVRGEEKRRRGRGGMEMEMDGDGSEVLRGKM